MKSTNKNLCRGCGWLPPTIGDLCEPCDLAKDKRYQYEPPLAAFRMCATSSEVMSP